MNYLPFKLAKKQHKSNLNTTAALNNIITLVMLFTWALDSNKSQCGKPQWSVKDTTQIIYEPTKPHDQKDWKQNCNTGNQKNKNTESKIHEYTFLCVCPYNQNERHRGQTLLSVLVWINHDLA